MKCLNRNVLIALGAIAVAVFFVAPGARSLLPLLLVAACPLSMVFMMRAMAKPGATGSSCSMGQADPQQTIESKDAEIAQLKQMLARDNRTNQA